MNGGNIYMYKNIERKMIIVMIVNGITQYNNSEKTFKLT